MHLLDSTNTSMFGIQFLDYKQTYKSSAFGYNIQGLVTDFIMRRTDFSGEPTELINLVAPLHNLGLVPSTTSVVTSLCCIQ